MARLYLQAPNRQVPNGCKPYPVSGYDSARETGYLFGQSLNYVSSQVERWDFTRYEIVR